MEIIWIIKTWVLVSVRYLFTQLPELHNDSQSFEGMPDAKHTKVHQKMISPVALIMEVQFTLETEDTWLFLTNYVSF